MTALPASAASALQLAGRPWTVWVVGAGLVMAARAEGAAGLDAVMTAIGPTIVWGGVSFVCRLVADGLGRRRLIMPADKPLPKPTIALIVTPPCPPEACPDLAAMVERLPEHLRRLVMPAPAAER